MIELINPLQREFASFSETVAATIADRLDSVTRKGGWLGAKRCTSLRNCLIRGKPDSQGPRRHANDLALSGRKQVEES